MFENNYNNKYILDATVANMQAYTQNLVNFARSSNLASTIYIFEAYDESWKPGDGVEKHWGLYTEATRTPKFNFDIASYGMVCKMYLNTSVST